MPTLSETGAGESVIRFEHVTKAYRLGAGRASLRETLAAAPRRVFSGGNGRADHADMLYAVNDLSFEVSRGTTLGIMGPNGAGKTTILKLLAGVTRPTSGRIVTEGRVSALIELGAGFHPDLTGRENVYLNGAILGLSRRAIEAKYDQIVAFAELEPFMDTPVKRYSSGMYARLGFAVAAHVDPEIMLVDEVLAVGDFNFQRKCFDFMHSFVNSGHTTVFVSHNLNWLEQLCDRIIWLEKGQARLIGTGQDVLREFVAAQEAQLGQLNDAPVSEAPDLQITRVYAAAADGRPQSIFAPGDDLVIHIDYHAVQPVCRPCFVVSVWDPAFARPVFLASMLVDDRSPEELFGSGTLSCRFEAPPLMPRTYQVWGEVWREDRFTPLVQWQPWTAFTVESEAATAKKGSLRHARLDAPVRVDYEWRLTPERDVV